MITGRESQTVDEPGDARIPALVERMAIGDPDPLAREDLRSIAKIMLDSGELKNYDEIYPGIRVVKSIVIPDYVLLLFDNIYLNIYHSSQRQQGWIK